MTVYENGILLDVNAKENEIAEAIVFLMSCDQKTLEKMQISARNNWEARFDAYQNAKDFTEDISRKTDIKNVILITERYPYAGERSFLETELCELLKRYQVRIIANVKEEYAIEHEKDKEENLDRIKKMLGDRQYFLQVCHTDCTQTPWKYLRYLASYLCDPGIMTEKNSVRELSQVKYLALWESMKYYGKARAFQHWIEKNMNCNFADTLFYTYWQSFSTLGLSFLKKSGREATIITRAHGYDLYDERNEKTHRLPFREEMDREIDSFYFISKTGLEYYLQRRRKEKNPGKYHVAYLGSRRPDDSSVPGEKRKDAALFRIVSCAAVIRLKRVDLIIKALSILKKRVSEIPETHKSAVEWVHFGDGDEMDNIRKMAGQYLDNTDLIRYRFMGKVDNDKVHAYYSCHQVDLFLTTSSSEGLPVSIMEAMSYGIPVIATNVGGIKEVFE